MEWCTGTHHETRKPSVQMCAFLLWFLFGGYGKGGGGKLGRGQEEEWKLACACFGFCFPVFDSKDKSLLFCLNVAIGVCPALPDIPSVTCSTNTRSEYAPITNCQESYLF